MTFKMSGHSTWCSFIPVNTLKYCFSHGFKKNCITLNHDVSIPFIILFLSGNLQWYIFGFWFMFCLIIIPCIVLCNYKHNEILREIVSILVSYSAPHLPAAVPRAFVHPLIHTFQEQFKIFFLSQIKILDGVAPLITDPTPTSSTTLSDFNNFSFLDFYI